MTVLIVVAAVLVEIGELVFVCSLCRAGGKPTPKPNGIEHRLGGGWRGR